MLHRTITWGLYLYISSLYYPNISVNLVALIREWLLILFLIHSILFYSFLKVEASGSTLLKSSAIIIPSHGHAAIAITLGCLYFSLYVLFVSSVLRTRWGT